MAADINTLKDWRYSTDTEAIAWAVFDREGERVNTLSHRAIEELGAIIADAEAKAAAGTIKGLVFMSGKEGSFIYGADIREFENFHSEEDVRASITQVTDMLNRLDKFKIPTVTAINGMCLGGGLELALACHWRIANRDDNTRVGFPEIKLGIFPGFNGTFRSIRQAGPTAAMTAMLTGNMIRASSAKGMGLIDELAPSAANLHWSARKAVLAGKHSPGPSLATRLMRQWPARGFLAEQMRKKTREKVREDHYPAPYALINLFDQTGDDDNAMGPAETRAFAPLMVSDTSRNLRRVFRLSEAMKAQAPKGNFKPTRAHVIGAGTMGADIAAVCVLAGMEVSLQDINPEQLQKALGQAKVLFKKRLKSRTEVDAAVARLLLDANGDHLPRADVVIEAVVERLDIKQKVFLGIEQRLKLGAVMATNTSSIMIEKIAEPLKDKGRLIGLHFFNPVPALPLVEVVRGADSRPEEIAKGCAVVTAIGKYPLVVKSVPGFLVNRVLFPYMAEAMQKLQSGTDREKIDEAAKTFGMPVGPLELADQVGLDVCKHVADILGMSAEKLGGSKLGDLVAAGKLGKKSGEGFYVWKDGKPVRANGETKYSTDELHTLGEDLIKPMIDECEKCRDEKVVDSADMVDAGVIFGTGFAPFRGGPLNYRASQKGVVVKQAVAAE
jgi:3-hydroxyacyl-CoA dehydrogenase / enoyl-CoA hydratase / 3-hydroxybutyryl-CoA epimerase